MKKADGFLIGFIMICSLLLCIPLLHNDQQPQTAVVKIRNEEVMRIDLSKDGTYTVDGTLGQVTIDVKDGKVAVTQENSLHHICSRQGYVSSSTTPIVCLPNETVVTIEGKDSDEDTVIS